MARAQAGAPPPGPYQSTFYPNGLPSGKDRDGNVKQATYNFYGDLSLGDDRVAVLFSEELGDGVRDHQFEVYLAIVKDNRNRRSVVAKENISAAIPVQFDGPGSVNAAGGVLNHVQHYGGITTFHVTVWGQLSGTGRIFGASDLFVGIDAVAPSIVPLLTLRQTSSALDSGSSYSARESTDLFQVDGAAPSERTITAVRKQRIRDGSDRAVSTVTLAITSYRFDGTQYVKEAGPGRVPVGAVALDRGDEVRRRFGAP